MAVDPDKWKRDVARAEIDAYYVARGVSPRQRQWASFLFVVLTFSLLIFLFVRACDSRYKPKEFESHKAAVRDQ